MVTAGDAAGSTRNLDNYLTILDNRGPDAALRATGVSADEAAEELSVAAVRGTNGPVPLSEPVASHRLAAEQAAKEILNTPDMASFRSTEELQDWIIGRAAEIRARVGSPLKDIHMKPIALPGGKTAYRMVFTVGKKDGFGFASAAAAKRSVRAMGFGGAEIAETTVARSVPRFESASRITNLSSTSNKGGGPTAYTATVVRPEGDPIPVSLLVDEDGVGRMEIKGLDQNQIGPVEMRALLAQLACWC